MKRFFQVFLPRVFTRVNLSKIFVIFIIGLIGRILINSLLDINVFVQFLDPVSIAYYSFMAGFVVFISELFTFFHISIIPNVLVVFFSSIVSMLKTILGQFKFEYLNPSVLRNACKDFFTALNDQTKISLGAEVGKEEVNKIQYDTIDPSSQEYLYNLDKKGKGVVHSSSEKNSSSSKGGGKVHHKSSGSSGESSGLRKSPKQNSLNDLYKKDESRGYTSIDSSVPSSSKIVNNPSYSYVQENNASLNDSPKSCDYYKITPKKGPVHNYGQDALYFGVSELEQDTSMSQISVPSTPSHYPATPSDFHMMYSDRSVNSNYPTLPYNYLPPSTPTMDPNLTTPETMTPLFPSQENIYGNDYIYDQNNSAGNVSAAFTNETNHASLGDRFSYVLMDKKCAMTKYKIQQAIEAQEAQNSIPQHMPMTLNKEELRLKTKGPGGGKFNLVFKYFDLDKFTDVCIKYKDRMKCKFFWVIWEKERGNYASYEEFKEEFDPNTKIFKRIEKDTTRDLTQEVQNLISSNPFGARKPITTRDIHSIGMSNTQDRLNNLNANRHGANDIEDSTNRHNRRHRHTDRTNRRS